MITCITHIAAANGKCLDCGVELPERIYVQGGGTHTGFTYRQGQSIGVISSPLTGAVAYVVGQHDSNKRCGVIGEASRLFNATQ